MSELKLNTQFVITGTELPTTAQLVLITHITSIWQAKQSNSNIEDGNTLICH